MGEDAILCGLEQVAVLPVAGVIFLVVLVYMFMATRKIVRDRSKLDQLVRLALQEAADEATEMSTQNTEASGIARSVTQALQDSRVLVLDLSEYHSARDQCRCVSRMFVGACLVAAAQPGSADLVYSACRMVVLALLWVQHEGSTAALRGGAARISERLATTSRALGLTCRSSAKNGIKRASKIPTGLSGLRGISKWGVWMHRAGILITHASTVAVLVFFEVYRHPALRDEACPDDGDSVPAVLVLLTGRAAALTLFAAWMLAVLSNACLRECEACIWLAPKAEERLRGLSQAQRGGSFSMGRGLELAEALCGAAGNHLADTLVRELHESFGVTVLCEGVALAPKPSLDSVVAQAAAAPHRPSVQSEVETQPGGADSHLTQKEFANFRRELQVEVRRSLNLSENRISEVLKSNENMVKAMENHMDSTPSAALSEKQPHRTASSPVESSMPGARAKSMAEKSIDRSARRERKFSKRSMPGRTLDNARDAMNESSREKRDADEDPAADLGLSVSNDASGAGTGEYSGDGPDPMKSPTLMAAQENLKLLRAAVAGLPGGGGEPSIGNDDVIASSPRARPPVDNSQDEPKSRNSDIGGTPPSNFGPRPRHSQSEGQGRRRGSDRTTPPRQSRQAPALSPIAGSPSLVVRETPPPMPVGSRVSRPSAGGRASTRGNMNGAPSPDGESSIFEREPPERPERPERRNRPSMRGPAMNTDEKDELARLRSEMGGDEFDASEIRLGGLGGSTGKDTSERRFASKPRPSLAGRRTMALKEKDEDRDDSPPMPRRSVGFRQEQDGMDIHNTDWPISMF